VAAKELGRFFVGAEIERGFCELAGRRIVGTERGCVLGEIRALEVADLDRGVGVGGAPGRSGREPDIVRQCSCDGLFQGLTIRLSPSVGELLNVVLSCSQTISA
jgi:hypothetical protein